MGRSKEQGLWLLMSGLAATGVLLAIHFYLCYGSELVAQQMRVHEARKFWLKHCNDTVDPISSGELLDLCWKNNVTAKLSPSTEAARATLESYVGPDSRVTAFSTALGHQFTNLLFAICFLMCSLFLLGCTGFFRSATVPSYIGMTLPTASYMPHPTQYYLPQEKQQDPLSSRGSCGSLEGDTTMKKKRV